MSTVVNIIIAILIISVIIVVHELGHFLLAKKNGVGVPEFSLGMGPRIFSFVKGETRYSLKLFPIGGSCEMVAQDEDSQDEKAFTNKGVWARISIIFAGPFFNFVLAYILAIIVLSFMGYDPAYVTQVAEGQPAAAAGLKAGDLVTSIDGSSVSIGRELATYFDFNKLTGDPIELTYERDGVEYETVLVPKLTKTERLGFNYSADTTPAKILGLVEGQPMEKAGAKVDDIILEVNGTKVKTGEELAAYFKQKPLTIGAETSILLESDGVQRTIKATPIIFEEYSAGFQYNYQVREKINPVSVLKYGFVEVKYWIVTTVKSVGKLVTGQLSTDQIGGPVRIVSELSNTVETAKEDGMLYIVMNLMNWAILLTANLGVMNLLPLPALDGGRLIFLLIEAVRGKPVNREKEGMIHLIGLILLMILMVFIFFNDIKNLF